MHTVARASVTHGTLYLQPMLTILVACKEPKAPGGLGHLPGGWRVVYNSLPNWAEASNILLDYAVARGGDALFLDDDVTLTAGSLDGVRAHYTDADLFGLDLHVLSTGERQAGARHTWDGAQTHDWTYPGPAYVAHVSTSAIYIKATAIQAGLRFPVWPGIYWEDVALCFEAWTKGLRVLAVPGLVYHDIEGGSGATKRHTPEFWAKWHANKAAFEAWCAERDLSGVPQGAVGV
jgi:GT2 family glycosyltransferase